MHIPVAAAMSLTSADGNGVASGAGVAAPADEAHAALRELAQAPLATPSKKGKQAGVLILILDEMDQLISQDRAILYSLFSLPQVITIPTPPWPYQPTHVPPFPLPSLLFAHPLH